MFAVFASTVAQPGWAAGTAAGSPDLRSDATKEAEAPRRYVPVEVRRGDYRLPSLAGEAAPQPGELSGAQPAERPSQYVPVQPLGEWSSAPSSRPATNDAARNSPNSAPASVSGRAGFDAALPPASGPDLSTVVSEPAVSEGLASNRPRDPLQKRSPPETADTLRSDGYVLQLAAFRRESSLDRFVAENSLEHTSLYRTQASGDDGSWWLLTYGVFPSRAAAVEAAGDFEDAHGLEVWVRPASRP